MVKSPNIAFVYNKVPPEKPKLEDYILHQNRINRLRVYEDLRERLSLPKIPQQAEAHTLDTLLKNGLKNFDLIVVENPRSRNCPLERNLIDNVSTDTLQNVVNLHGEHIVRQDLEMHGLEGLDLSLYRELRLGILADNKLFLYLLAGDDHPTAIKLYGYGFEVRRDINGKALRIPFNKNPVIVKPVGGSHGSGVQMSSRRDVNLLALDDYILGCQVVQMFVEQDSRVRFGRATDLRVIVTRERGEYSYLAMVRVGAERSICSNLAQGGIGIGIVPGEKIRDNFERKIVRGYGIDPDNPALPKEVLGYAKEMADLFGYPCIGLDFITEKVPRRDEPKFRLLEVNSNPGSRIYHYTRRTRSRKLDDFVREQRLDKISSDDFISGHEIAKTCIVKVLTTARLYGFPTEDAEQALDLDNKTLAGFKYDGFDRPMPIVRRRIDVSYSQPSGPIEDTLDPTNYFHSSFIKKLLKLNGVNGSVTAVRGNRQKILDNVLEGEIRSSVLNVRMSLEQGIVLTYDQLRRDLNQKLGLPLDTDVLYGNPRKSTNAITNYMNRAIEFLYTEANCSLKQLDLSERVCEQGIGSANTTDKVRLYERAIEIDPLYVRALRNLAIIYARLGKRETSRKLFARILENQELRTDRYFRAAQNASQRLFG